MNIIISSLGTDGVRFVNYDSSSSYDINKIKVFISKALELIPEALELYYNDPSIDDAIESNPTHALPLALNSAFEKPNYYCYDIHSDFAIIQQSYTASLKFNDGYHVAMPQNVQVFNGLEDEHGAIVINDRTIGKIPTVLVAEDYASAQITFLIKERYDGVSFLDENKKIYIDYIPVGFKPFQDDLDPNNIINFLSDEIIEKNVVMMDGAPWIKLHWNVPSTATKTAGTVKLALSVISITEPMYVWQTLPTTMTISPNLGLRPIVPVIPDEEPGTIENALHRIAVLEDKMENIDMVSYVNPDDGTITYTEQVDGNVTTTQYSVFDLAYSQPADQQEVVIMGGGGAKG